jgi:hypothetical protein
MAQILALPNARIRTARSIVLLDKLIAFLVVKNSLRPKEPEIIHHFTGFHAVPCLKSKESSPHRHSPSLQN